MTGKNNKGVFSSTEIIELCDSIKDIHRLLKTVGEFFTELDSMEDISGNGLHIDFKKWGIRTIAKDLLERQSSKISRIAEIYWDEQKAILDKDIEVFQP